MLSLNRTARGSPLQPKVTLMRIFASTILAAGTFAAVAQSDAQTYDPDYPVCLHVYGPVTYYECRYTSLPQCNMSASGRAAQCVINPYFASAAMGGPVVRHHHRHYRAY
jgi:hypothetical protein